MLGIVIVIAFRNPLTSHDFRQGLFTFPWCSRLLLSPTLGTGCPPGKLVATWRYNSAFRVKFIDVANLSVQTTKQIYQHIHLIRREVT